ncbi:MAG: M15 family metallopeptidase [Candidatus Gracilibacteria bacterium]|nr:M15 family metallopeptidase [Candidatus Gracilibacteria bacterium]
MGKINNINLLTKISLKIVIFLMGFWSFLGYVDAATIQSISTGGSWYDTNSWINGIIPSENDEIIINGNITDAVNIKFSDLIINSGGYLTGYSSGGGDHSFTGNIIINNGGTLSYNFLYLNGTIINNGSFTNSYYLYFNGNIENNGIFDVDINTLKDGSINIYGTSRINSVLNINHNIDLQGNIYVNYLNVNYSNINFLNNTNIKVKNGIQFYGNINNGNNLNLESNGGYLYFDFTGKIKKLITNNSQNEEIVFYKLNGEIDDLEIYSQTRLQNGYSQDNFVGNIDVKSNGKFTLNTNLYLNGNLRNYGEVSGYLYINGKLDNNGVWSGTIYSIENGVIELLGNNDFNNLYLYLQSNSSIYGNGVAIDMIYLEQSKNLTILPNTILKTKYHSGIYGNIINGDNLNLEILGGYGDFDFTGKIKKLITNNSQNEEIVFYKLNGEIDDLEIYSQTRLQNGYTQDNFNGNIEIKSSGKFQASSSLYLSGNILNNGEISGNIYINGKLENNGIWNGIIYSVENGTIELLGTNSFLVHVEIGTNSNFKPNNSTINSINSYQNINLTILGKNNLKVENNIYIFSNIVNGENLKIKLLGGNGYLNFSGNIGEFELENINNIPINIYDLNGNINLTKINSQVLFSGYSYNGYNLNGDLIIDSNGNLQGYINTFLNGNFKNKGLLNGYLYVNGGIENNGNMNYIGVYTDQNDSTYTITAPGENEIISYENKYLFYPHAISEEDPTITFVGNNSGFINIYDENNNLISDNCINISGCVNIIEKDWDNTNLSNYYTYDLTDGYVCNANQNTAQNASSGPLIFDVSKLTIKTNEAETKATISEDSSLGDPVILNTGEFDYDNTLISYAGNNLPFEFKIKYKNKAFYNGPIGNNFDFNYNIYLTQDIDGNINLHDGKLGVYNFYKDGTNFTRNEYIKANLEFINNKYQITFDDKSKYTFGENFKIEKLEDTYGNYLSFEYNTNSQLIKIIDTLNREYTFSYYADSRIYKINDFLGKETEFIYFAENETLGSQFDLKTIKMYSGISEKQIDFTYTIGTDFESSHNIVKLIDSANNTYVENTYDSFDRVSSQTYGNGTIYYNYTVDTNNKITKNSVTDREGNIIEYYYDSFGNTIKKIIKKASGDLEYNYQYDTNNNLIKEIKPLGNGITYNYDINNNVIEKRLVENTSSTGSTSDIVLNYTYDLNTNKPTQIIEPNGLITNLTYDANNNLVSKEIIGVKDYDGTDININESFTYNGSGQLIGQTNALGLETSFEYTNGNLTKITKGTGSLAIENNFVYDTRGNMVKIIDGRSNETNLSYSDFNLLISKTTSEGIVNEIVYNSLNKKTSEKIILGTSEELNISYNYDILDNLTNSTNEIDSGINLISNYTYDTNSRIIETSSGSGATESYNYDENGLILSKTVSYGNNNVTTSYNYDSNERLIKQTNPNNSEINFEYDLFDRIIKKVNVDNSYTTYTYDKSNNITKQEIYDENDNLLSKHEFVYDKQNKVIETKNHILPNDIITTKTKYDSLGNTIKSIDGKGNETNNTYDIFGRLIQVQDELGNKVINIYDKNNNLTQKQIISSSNKTITTNYTYDSDNRLISETNNLNKSKTYTYNKLNQVISITDEEGNITNYTYTYTGKVKTENRVTNSGNLTTSYTYDNMGNMTSVTDSEGNITNYQYDQLNRLVKQIYADEKEVNYVYDTNNNLVQKTDKVNCEARESTLGCPNGTIINYTYDSQNRLISKNITNGNGVVGITSETYSYDSLGRMIEANDSNNHKIEFSYDSLGRMITETQSGSLVSYGYDNNNNLTSINDVNYSYDNLNRITNIGYDSNNIAAYNYTGLENTSIIYDNNTSIIKGYDSLSRTNSLNNGVNTYNYTYDDVNNITSDSIKNYLYDDIYRLKEVQNNTNQEILESFNYDDVGNRINNFNSKTGSGASFDYETNILNQYTSLSGSISSYELQEIIEEIQTGSGETQTITTYTGSLVTTNENTSFVYDNNGNLKNNGTFEFSYDYKNRLTKVETSSGIIAQYSYDVLNRRYLKETENERVEYIYSNENTLQEITTDETTNITTTKNYINGSGLDDLIAYEENNDIYYFHKNHLGSVEGISDSSGNIVVSYEYDSFGNFEITSGTDNGNTRLYTGREYDSEIGLYYFRARYYSAEIGRFISRDPIDIADDVNLYAYVGNNSLNYVDLMGTEGKPLIEDMVGSNLLSIVTRDPISEKRIMTLNPLIRDDVRDFLDIVYKDLKINLRVAQSMRTIDEQNNLYNQGRTSPGNIVTWVKGGGSYHNYGLAFDIVEIDKNGKINYDIDWNKVSKIGKDIGFEWGGDWKTSTDKPHFQKTYGFTTTELKKMIEDGNIDNDGFIIFKG